MDVIATRIFDLVKEHGIEQKEFALMLGVTDKKVSAWKTGRSSTYTKILPQIADALSTTTEYLLNGTKIEKPETLSGSGLSEGEELLIQLFRLLPQEEKDAVLRVVQAAAAGQRSPE